MWEKKGRKERKKGNTKKNFREEWATKTPPKKTKEEIVQTIGQPARIARAGLRFLGI